MSASLPTRTGLLQRLASLSWRGKLLQSGCRLVARMVTPRLTMPGNPTETRSKSGKGVRNSSSAESTASGVGTAGVTTRSRALTELPAASSSMAFSPEPPMSMASVTGCVGLGERSGAATDAAGGGGGGGGGLGGICGELTGRGGGGGSGGGGDFGSHLQELYGLRARLQLRNGGDIHRRGVRRGRNP